MARHSSCPPWANPAAYDWKSRVMKQAERWATQRAQSEQGAAERSSLVRLAYSATRLHKAGIAKGMTWPAGEGSPLAVATAALATAAKQRKESSP
jgi:hypothetical protein